MENMTRKIADSFSKIIEISDSGYKIDTEYFKKFTLRAKSFSSKMISLLGSNRKANDPLNQRHKNIAYAAQKAFESLLRHY